MAAIFLDCTAELLPLWQVAAARGPAVALAMHEGQPPDVPGLIAGYDTVVVDHTYFDAGLLARCGGALRRLIFLGTGASSFIDVAAAAALGIRVETIKGYGDTTVAEHTLALALAAARGIAQGDRDVRAGLWRKSPGVQLFGKAFGVLGLGGVGREVCRLAAGIGMQVLAWNRSAGPGVTATLDEVLTGSDVLAVCLALTEQTRGFLSAERLGRMKPGVIFVNTARADVVDGAALAGLIRSGHVRAAGVDVFAPEPPSPGDALLHVPGVTLTPHAGFMTEEATLALLQRALGLVAAGAAPG